MHGWGHLKNSVKSMDVSGKISVDVTWGDDNGPTVTISGSGSVSDDNGNSASATASQDSDGNGKISVEIEHKE